MVRVASQNRILRGATALLIIGVFVLLAVALPAWCLSSGLWW
jgi:hypothetical protein